MRIAVVILNWNGRELLERFLPSVVAHSQDANLYLADNASTDDSVSYTQAHFPELTIIQNKINGGYAKGYNDALRQLDEDILVLLNSDVKVTPNWLKPIRERMSFDSSVFALQPKILDLKRPDFFEYAGAAGGYLDQLGYPYCRGRLFDTIEKDEGQYNDQKEIFWATGACLAVRRKAFNDVGGFDEDFFAHQEEIDLCWRLRSINGKVLYISESEIYHLGGATLATKNPKKTFYNFRNTLLLLVKNVKGIKALRLVFTRLLLDAVAGIQFLVSGKPKHFFAILKAHIDFYRLLPKFLKKRKKWATTLPFYEHKSVVFQYFIKNRKRFDELQ